MAKGLDHGGDVALAMSGGDAGLEQFERRGGGAQFEGAGAGLATGVSEVLGHEAKEKVGSIIGCGHAAGDGLDQRTPGRAIGEDFERLGAPAPRVLT